MALDEQQLAGVLQACIDHARELLEESGGFLPFGARGKLDGEIEFIEASEEGRQEPPHSVYRKIAGLLAQDARRNEILASALIANASLPAGYDDTFETAIAVLIEAPDFCRSITVPYRITANGVELGKMIPEETEPAIFVGGPSEGLH